MLNKEQTKQVDASAFGECEVERKAPKKKKIVKTVLLILLLCAIAAAALVIKHTMDEKKFLEQSHEFSLSTGIWKISSSFYGDHLVLLYDDANHNRRMRTDWSLESGSDQGWENGMLVTNEGTLNSDIPIIQAGSYESGHLELMLMQENMKENRPPEHYKVYAWQNFDSFGGGETSDMDRLDYEISSEKITDILFEKVSEYMSTSDLTYEIELNCIANTKRLYPSDPEELWLMDSIPSGYFEGTASYNSAEGSLNITYKIDPLTWDAELNCDFSRAVQLCKVQNCSEPAYTGGYCREHLFEATMKGGPLICASSGCNEPVYRDGYCVDHYFFRQIYS